MSKALGFEVPEDMLLFWNACLLIHSIKLLTKEKEDEIISKTGYTRAKILAIRDWMDRLTDDQKAETIGAGRFDLFETMVIQLMLTDNIAIANRKLRSVIENINDPNALSAAMGTMLNKWEMLKDVYMKHKSQSGRADTTKTNSEKYDDNVPGIVRFG